jgi:hypothetical protein
MLPRQWSSSRRQAFTVSAVAKRGTLLLIIFLVGCAAGEPPSGPGAASATNLSRWLKNASAVTYTGRLQHFHCTSERGNYYTWSLDPAGDEDAAEVDVRACAHEAQRLRDQRVTITGKLIPREPRHFPLLVAEQITPAGALMGG